MGSAMPEASLRRFELSETIGERLRTPFDATLSDPNRLRIQAALHGLEAGGSIRFTALAKALGLSDGNLSAHLAVLTEVGYVTTHESYTGKRRTRWYSATAVGREAFEAHVRALQLIVDSARARPVATPHPRSPQPEPTASTSTTSRSRTGWPRAAGSDRRIASAASANLGDE